MSPFFSVRFIRAGVGACLVLAILGALGAAVRLIPFILHPDVKTGVVLVFARSVAIAVLEVALSVGWPVGWAMLVADLVEKGEIRTLELLGRSPFQIVSSLKWHVFVAFLVVAGVSAEAGVQASRPGEIVQDLIRRGQESCAAGPEESHPVPLIGATWLCFHQGSRILITSYASTPVTAREADVAPDLSSVSLTDAQVDVPGIHIGANRLVLKGFAPWTLISALSPWIRGLALGMTSLLCALASARALMSARVGSKSIAIILGGAGPLAVLGLFRALDRGLPIAALSLAPLLAVVAPLLLLLIIRNKGRFLRSTSSAASP